MDGRLIDGWVSRAMGIGPFQLLRQNFGTRFHYILSPRIQKKF